MVRRLKISFLLVIMCVFIVGCKQEKKEVKIMEETSEDTIKFDENGVTFYVPEKWLASDGRKIILNYEELEENIPGQIILGYISEETIYKIDKMREELNNISDEDTGTDSDSDTDTTNDLEKEVKDLCRIITIDKEIIDEYIIKELFDNYDNTYLIGKEDNFEFYLLYNNKIDTEGLTEMSKKDYEDYYEEIENFKSLIKVYKPTTETERVSKNKLEFTTTTLDGSEIDSNILKNSKITMVNIWGTFCQPCIDEMPEIQSLYEEVKGDEINIIGIISDTPDKDNEELAKRIISAKGVQYTNIIPDETLINNVLNNISAVPTTLFVDEEGNIIGDLIVGERNKEEYKAEIIDRLEIINK